jgi:hypothetical protein
MKMENSVKFVRLVTGEDIIAEVTHVESDTEAYYVLSNPLKVVYMSGSKAGILSVSLMQWVFWRICEEQQFTIYPEDVLTVAKPTDHMEEYYWSSVDHFSESKEKLNKQTQFEDAELDDEPGESSEFLESIMELLKNSDKGKLH